MTALRRQQTGSECSCVYHCTATAPTWDDIGRLGAIAVIRTFLNYFLERDIVEAQRLKLEEARLPEEAKSTL